MEPDALHAARRAGTVASARCLEPEIMDDPELDPELHRRALAGLGRINRLSFVASTLWPRVARGSDRGGRLRILDLATGGGDVAVALWRRGRRAGIDVRVMGIDISAVAVELARERAVRAGARACEFVRRDVFDEALPAGHDVVMSSIFFHHLRREQAVDLLRRMALAARRRVVVEDLRRCTFGGLLAATVPRLITRSRVVHVDALRSARAAFTPAEMRSMAREAGLEGARVRPHWPARMTLIWEQP